MKGIVFDKDSISPMPFAYAVNSNSGIGTLTDEAGKFVLQIKIGDTLRFSYLGYSVTKVFTHTLKDSVKNSSLRMQVYLKQKITELKPVIIATHSFSKEQKELYERKIGEYERGLASAAASPITALYYLWSHKGKELKKLSALYDQLLIEEIKEHRLSPEKVRMITGNDTLDTGDFLNRCYLPDYVITTASDYELFLLVKNYYREYSKGKHR